MNEEYEPDYMKKANELFNKFELLKNPKAGTFESSYYQRKDSETESDKRKKI